MAFKHESWSSSTAFMLAAVGAAVGLGNIWRFPYMAGSNGGGAFVLIYLIAVLLIALPALIAETMIGRHGHMSAPVSMTKAAEEVGASRKWAIVGWFGVAAAFLILSFYSVIGFTGVGGHGYDSGEFYFLCTFSFRSRFILVQY